MKNKKVLLTGSNGFLGKYLLASLVKSGAEVMTLGRNHGDVCQDLAIGIPTLPADIDYVVHAAGKAHSVPKTKEEAHQFYKVNHQGTLHLLEALKQNNAPVKAIVFISTVAVYGLMQGFDVDEKQPLNADDPYGKSKIMAEKAVKDFCEERNINYCILRLPLIAGNNAPGNLGSMVKAIRKGWYLSIGNADVKKSMVLAEDVAALLPSLFEKKGIYNLTDGYHPTFNELEQGMAAYLGKKNPARIPQRLANVMAKTGDMLGKKSPINSPKLKKIQSELTFSDAAAVKELGWKPRRVIDHFELILG